MHINQILESVRGIKGTNAKVDYLRGCIGNDALKESLYRTYEPDISYWLSPNEKMKEQAMSPSDNSRDMTAVFRFLDNLSNRVVTGHAAKSEYSQVASTISRDGIDVLNTILARDIRAGLASKQINKVWPSLITEIPYMRCSLPEESGIKNWAWGTDGFTAYSQVKADGMFAYLTVSGHGEDAKCKVMSRRGSKFLEGSYFDKLFKDAKRVADASNWSLLGDSGAIQFHGELLVFKNGVLMPREKGNGILNSILKTGESVDADGNPYDVRFCCWDISPADEKKGTPIIIPKGSGKLLLPPLPYSSRIEMLENAISASGVSSGAFSLVESRPINTYEAASKHFLEVIKNGGEGTVVKHHSGIWADGDSKHQVKMKVAFHCDLKVIGFNPGKGKNESTFGSLVCQSSDGELEVGISGMSGALRQEIWDNRDDWLGKVVAVVANSVTEPSKSNSKYALFLPRILECRLDKSQADDIKTVQAQYDAALQGRELQGELEGKKKRAPKPA